jgi:hypothetical protein
VFFIVKTRKGWGLLLASGRYRTGVLL